MRKIFMALCATLFALPIQAKDITTRDQLISYLKEQMPDGQEISLTFKLGQTLSAGNRHGNCMSVRTFSQLSLPTQLLIQKGLMVTKVTKEDTGYRVIGSTAPSCEYEITGFKPAHLARRGVSLTSENGKVVAIKVPLFTQRLLGVDDVDLQGYTSMGDVTCDLYFSPWFENLKPSTFSEAFKELCPKVGDGCHQAAI